MLIFGRGTYNNTKISLGQQFEMSHGPNNIETLSRVMGVRVKRKDGNGERSMVFIFFCNFPKDFS